MKKTILTLAAIATLASCRKSDTERLNEMRAPVIVRSSGYDALNQVIIAVDADGHAEEFNSCTFDDLKIGDTIIPAPKSSKFVQSDTMNKYARQITSKWERK